MESYCGSPFWNASDTWNTENPFFTQCFHETIFVWVPCFFLWLFAPYEIYKYSRSKNRNIPMNLINVSRVVLTVGLFVTSMVNIGYVVPNHNQGINTQVMYLATPAIKAATYLLSFCLLLYAKHMGIRSSYPIFVFWLLSVLGGAFTVRAMSQFYSTEYFYYTFIVAYTLTVVMFLLYCFADGEPRIYDEDYKTPNPCPREMSSSLSKLTFWWMDRLMQKGYKKESLEMDDIFDLDPTMKCKSIAPRFQRNWERKLQKQNRSSKGGKISIVPILIRSFGWYFFVAMVFKTAYDVLGFVKPQVLKYLINFVSDKTEETWKGYFYAGILLAVGLLQTALISQYSERSVVTGMRIKAALVSAIYRKALTMSNEAKKESTTGQITNLMAVDAQRVTGCVTYITNLWSCPLVISLALYFLWGELGVATLAGLAILIVAIPLNAFITNTLKKFHMKLMKCKDQRIKVLTQVLSGMKVIKFWTWEPSFHKRIADIRRQEVTLLKKVSIVSAFLIFVMTSVPAIVTLVTFATYLFMDGGRIMYPATAFVSISLFGLLRQPLAMLPMMLIFFVQTAVSVTRLNRFLNCEDVDPDSIGYDNSVPEALIVESGTFTWDLKEAPLLRNVNVRVPEGKLVAVVGPVGSGKSSLLHATLGEMDKISGRINIKGTLSYAQQQPWIQNMSVRDNILFGKTLETVKYNKIIEACALKSDLFILPDGDETEIGEKGINLSGGQKQRVSLARAIYSDCDTYLLDDPLSAVDSHVGKHIFEKVIGPNGLLRNKSRVLVTHGISFLPQVDEIIVMNNGEITETGAYKDLLARKGVFAEFLMQHLAEEQLDGDDDGDGDGDDVSQIREQLKQAMGDEEFQKRLSRQVSRLSVGSSDAGSFGSRRNSSRWSRRSNRSVSMKPTVIAEQPKVMKERTKLIKAEDAQTGAVTTAVYLRYFRSMGCRIAITAILTGILSQALSILANLWLNDWTDQPLDVNGNRATSSENFILIYAALVIGQAICSLIVSLSYAIGTLYATIAMHEIILERIFRCPMAFFETTPLGRIVNRFSKDVDVADNSLPMNIRMLSSTIYGVIGSAIVIIYGTPWMAIVIVAVGIVYFLIQRYYIITTRQLQRLQSITTSPLYSHFQETLTGTATIRAYKAQERFIFDSERKVDTMQKFFYPNAISSRWLGTRLETLGNLLIFSTAVLAVAERDTIDPGVMGLVINYSSSITAVLRMFVQAYSSVQTNMVAIERIQEYAELPEEPEWANPDHRPPKDWPQEGVLEFDNYQTRYREGLDLVLKGISCHIQSEEKIGVVGRTGAGKSSLTLALYRIIEAAGGRILIDGQDISKMGLHDLRGKLTIIPQDPVLFSGTLRMNLDPFDEHTDDELWIALEHAHLKTYTDSLTQGLQSLISENGENLSVGQRQLVCLARALLRKTKVLILDEATAAVDLETDDLIQKTIRTAFNDCTILTIAHRLNTIMDNSRVIVMDQGQICEFDTPANLLSNPSTMFYSMAKDAGLV